MSALLSRVAYNFRMQRKSENGSVGRVLGLAALLIFSYIPILQVLGWGRWMLAGRWFSATPVSSTIFYFALYFAAVGATIVWPMTTIKKRNNFMAVLMTVLASLPLASFAAWQGNARAWWEVADAALFVLPASWCAVHCSMRTGKHAVAGFFLAAITFVPLFLVNDILTPYPVLFGFSARVAEFARTALAIRAVAAVACLFIPVLAWDWVRDPEGEENSALPREFLNSLQPPRTRPAE